MDLNELILTLVASGGGVAVIAAGLWALTRPSGSDTDGKEAPEKDAKGERKEAAKPERPAAPTWGESLSAPAKKPAREAESEEEEGADASRAPVDAEVPHEGGVQASDTAEATPAAPVAPAEPVEPVEPVAPVEPVETAEPVDPVEPVEPAEPVAPAEEVEQADVEAEPPIAWCAFARVSSAPDRLAEESSRCSRAAISTWTRGTRSRKPSSWPTSAPMRPTN